MRGEVNRGGEKVGVRPHNHCNVVREWFLGPLKGSEVPSEKYIGKAENVAEAHRGQSMPSDTRDSDEEKTQDRGNGGVQASHTKA